jgi:PKD repeat protein
MARNTLPKSFAHANGRAVFFKSNNGWRLAVATEGPRATNATGGLTLMTNQPQTITGGEGTTTPSPMELLIADWGQTESIWDLNGDGTVNVTDLLMLIGDWEQYYQGATGGSNQDPIAQWSNPPVEYVIGSGADVTLQMLSGAPAGVHVVFQTWSDVAEAIEGVHQDFEAPFVYPASALGQVTPGGGEIQALVRTSSNQILATIRANVAFVAAEPPLPPPPTTTSGTGGTTGTSGNGGTGGTGGTTGTGGSGGTSEPAIANPGADPNAPAPVPAITLLSNSGQAPFTVHAHGLASTLGVGDASTARYEWNFGNADGDYNTLVGFNAAHVYDQPGQYTITLKVTNQAGKPALATATVTVLPSARTWSSMPKAWFNAGEDVPFPAYVQPHGPGVISSKWISSVSPGAALRMAMGPHMHGPSSATGSRGSTFCRGAMVEVGGSSPQLTSGIDKIETTSPDPTVSAGGMAGEKRPCRFARFA